MGGGTREKSLDFVIVAEHLNVQTLTPPIWLHVDRLASCKRSYIQRTDSHLCASAPVGDAEVSETISQSASISALSTGPRIAPVPLRFKSDHMTFT